MFILSYKSLCVKIGVKTYESEEATIRMRNGFIHSQKGIEKRELYEHNQVKVND